MRQNITENHFYLLSSSYEEHSFCFVRGTCWSGVIPRTGCDRHRKSIKSIFICVFCVFLCLPSVSAWCFYQLILWRSSSTFPWLTSAPLSGFCQRKKCDLILLILYLFGVKFGRSSLFTLLTRLRQPTALPLHRSLPHDRSERGCPASGRTEDIINDRIVFKWTNALEGAAKLFHQEWS